MGACILIWDIKSGLGTRVFRTYFYLSSYISYLFPTSAKKLRVEVCESTRYVAINSDYWLAKLIGFS